MNSVTRQSIFERFLGVSFAGAQKLERQAPSPSERRFVERPGFAVITDQDGAELISVASDFSGVVRSSLGGVA